MKGDQFATLYRNNKLSQSYVVVVIIIINDTDRCKDTDHLNEFSTVLSITK